MTDTQKILEEFDSRKHNWRLDFDFWEKDIKDVLTASIQEALADERARVRGIIGSPEWLENHHCGNNDGSSVCNCFKEALNTLLFSLNKPVTDKDQPMTDTQRVLAEFDRKFVKDCGPDVEPIFKDADGSVGPIRRFLADELAKARAELLLELLQVFNDYDVPLTMTAEQMRDILVEYLAKKD